MSITPPSPPSITHAQVVRVIDGDTAKFYVPTTDTTYTVRFLGIDTPETVDPRKPVECFGPQASTETKYELPPGYSVTLKTDPTQATFDMYGRLLAYIFLKGQRVSVNYALLRGGYARVYTFGKTPVSLFTRFNAAQSYAIKHNLGLWGACPS